MIKRFRVVNFKAIHDSGPIDIRPITVLAGPNSSGKSSLIQSLLLLKQTLASDKPGVDLDLDGPLVQATSLSDLVLGKPAAADASTSIDITITSRFQGPGYQELFPGAPAIGESDTIAAYATISLTFASDVTGGTEKAVLSNFSLSQQLRDITGPGIAITRRRDGFDVKLTGRVPPLPKEYRGRLIVDVPREHFLPVALSVDSAQEEATGHRVPAYLPLPSMLSSAIQLVGHQLTNHVDYLGPFREQPRRAYLHSATGLRDIGPRGEYAAQILWDERNSRIDYPPLVRRRRQPKLIDAMNDALTRIGVGHGLRVQSIGETVYQLLFPINGPRDRTVTIADVGFGLSQLLPVVLLALRGQSLKIYEQPEIHLHPRSQANLADFFVMLSDAGRQFLIETHSDHFINRLRRRIAEDASGTLRDRVQILFVHRRGDGGPMVEPLEVDEYGNIINWPEDFLPEAADEAAAIVRAGVAKRQMEKLDATTNDKSC